MVIVFAAGIVRGFAGFGFSALSVAGMFLLLPLFLHGPVLAGLKRR
jgi:hypothetical protein